MASVAEKMTPPEQDQQAPVTKLFDEAEIARRVAELAPEIARAMPDDFTIVALLKGAFVFTADLARALDRAGRRPRIDFMTLSSYGHGRESSGRVRLIGEPPAGISGRAVLLIDDVADSGRSLAFARDLLAERGAGQISICALIDKPGQREVPLAVDFAGFTVGDSFVVGYGIDYAERYRHLPYIGALD